MLRGIQGFGLKHHLRTDRSLSLAENLPMTAIAVDTGPNIEAVLDQTLELNLPGLVTLEQARLLSGEIEPAGTGDDVGESARLTVYFGRHDRVYGVPAFEVICELLYRREIGGATALLGVDGTAHGRRQQSRLFSRNADLPVIVVAVGSGDRIGMVLPELAGLLRHPLMTLEQVRICKRYGHLINVRNWPPESTTAASRSGTSSRSTPRKRPGTRASRSNGPSCGGCVRPGSAAPRPTAASGASTVTARRTAIVSCSSDATYPRSRP